MIFLKGEAMSNIDLEELKRLAEAATPGPWESVARTNAFWDIEAPEQPGYAEKMIASVSRDEDNSAFIAAVNPQVVLALIRELEEARRGADRYEFVRRLSPAGFSLLCAQNLQTGALFDDLVDAARQDQG